MNTDTCPDCSNIPCDCGIPAGYSPTPTPWTDANEEDGWNPCGWAVDSNLVRELERELAAVTEQRDGLRSAVDYASDQLTRVTEQRDAASAEFYRYHGLWDRATKQLETVMYQRDRLAEAMTRIKNIYENPEKGCIPSSSDMYDEALQSLTTNEQ